MSSHKDMPATPPQEGILPKGQWAPVGGPEQQLYFNVIFSQIKWQLVMYTVSDPEQ